MCSIIDNFIAAVNKGDNQMIKTLLKSGERLNVNIVFRDRRRLATSALHEAAKTRNEELVKLLLEQGAWLNVRDSKVMRPINYAAKFGCDNIIMDLVKAGARVNAFDALFMQPLSYAVSTTTSDVVAKLLDEGTESEHNMPNLHPNQFSNVLTYAALTGSLKNLKLVANHPFIKLGDLGCFNLLSLILLKARTERLARLEIVMEAIEDRYGLEKLRSLLMMESNITQDKDDAFKYKTVNCIFHADPPIPAEERRAIIRLLLSKKTEIGWQRDQPPASRSVLRLGDVNLLEDCVKNRDYKCAQLAIINGVNLSPSTVFSHLSGQDAELYYNLLATTQGHSDLIKKPRSLKHLARVAWLQQKPVFGNKEELINSLELPGTLRAYLRLDDLHE